MDVTAPVFAGATVDGTALTVAFNEILNQLHVPAASAFTVTVGGATRGVGTVAIGSGGVTLTLASGVTDSDTGIKVRYTKPTGSALQDGAGNAVATFADQDVTNRTDTTAPTLVSARLENGNDLTMVFSESLNGAPSSGVFTVKLGGTVTTFNFAGGGSGTELYLHLHTDATAGQAVTLSYAKGSAASPLRDRAGNETADFTDVVVTNLTGAPAVSGGVTLVSTPPAGQVGQYKLGDTVRARLTFDAAVDVAGSPVLKLFLGEGPGERDMTFDAAGGRTNVTALEFTYRIAAGDKSAGAGLGFHANRLSVGTGSSIRATGTTVNADLRHTGLDQSHAHRVDGIVPTLLGAALSGAALTLTWDEALDTGSVPAAGDFAVKVAGSTVSLAQVAPVTVVGRSVTLALASAVANSGQTVTVSYTKGAKPVQDTAGNGVANFTDKTVVLGTVPPAVTGVALASEPPTGQNGFYRAGDEVRARVTFDRAVDVAGSPVLYLQLDPSFGEKAMTFDANAGRTNTRTLDFTYEVAAGDASPTGIGFYADKLSVPSGATIRAAGTSVGAGLGHGAVAHDAEHKVDAVVPSLAAADPVWVSSSAGDDGTYAIGDVIELTATFNEVVEATAEARIAFTLGEATKYAAYRSGSGTAELVFGYEVTEGDADGDGIEAAANALELNGGTIADPAGNEAGAAQLEHAAVAASASHKVDGVSPSLSGANVSGATLTLTWDEALDTGSVPASGDFTVTVAASGRGVASVAVAGSAVTLTLASAAAPGHAVTVQYDAGASPIRDVAGNAAADLPARMVKANTAPRFVTAAPSTLSVAENSAGGTAVGTVAAEDTDNDTLAYSLDTASDAVFDIDASGAITVASGATLDRETTPSYAVTVGVSDGKTPDGGADAAVDATHAVTVEVTNVEEPPGAPAAPEMAAQSATHVTVRWAAPSDLGAVTAVADYDLRYYAGSADPADEADWVEEGEANGPPDPGTATSATISGLTANTAYRVQVRAAGDGEGAWSPSAGVSTNDAPVVSAVALVGTPASGQDDKYKLGDAVRARVTFDRAVDVVGDPVLKLRLDATDSGARAMTFDASGGRTNVTALDFTWTVAAGDASAKGIAFRANELSAPSGVTIQAAGTTVDAELSHGAVAASASHRVDGVRPAFSSATVTGTRLVVTFTEPLNAAGATKPASSVFTVTATKNGTNRTIAGGTAAVTIRGAVATATLSSAVTHDETVTVAYAKPGANPLTDLAGNAAADSTGGAVRNVTGDTTPPTLTSGTVDLQVVKLYFSEALDPARTPAATDFVLSSAPNIEFYPSSVAISGSTVTLGTDNPYIGHDPLKMVTTASIDLRDLAGNKMAPNTSWQSPFLLTSLRGQGPGKPALVSTGAAVVDGDTLTLTYDRTLHHGKVPPAAAFTVAGTDSATTVDAVAIRRATAVLTLSPAVASGDTGVTVSYDKTKSPPIQNPWGTQADSFSNQAVTNATTGARRWRRTSRRPPTRTRR